MRINSANFRLSRWAGSALWSVHNQPDMTSSIDLIASGDFDSTTILISANSDKGRDFLRSEFGIGCVSVEIRKSQLGEFSVYASNSNCKVA